MNGRTLEMGFRQLTDLANLYGSDKGTIGPHLRIGHNYTDIYEAYLSYRREDIKNVLEIGIGVQGENFNAVIASGTNEEGGASLKMWHDYFPNAIIYGIDINSAEHLENDRVRTYMLDQGNISQLKEFNETTKDIQFDIIIDDGSHLSDHQQITLGLLFPRLCNGGLYFIEDLLSFGERERTLGVKGSNNVRDTRSVLRFFQETGEFGEPNNIIEPDKLKSSIKYLSFHVPEIEASIQLKTFFLHFFRGKQPPANKKYLKDSENMCVIHKN